MVREKHKRLKLTQPQLAGGLPMWGLGSFLSWKQANRAFDWKTF
jgi:hypothetical protein